MWFLYFCRKTEKPVSADCAGGPLESWCLLLLPWNAEVRRHARRMMMVMMTMVDANWHLCHHLRMQAGGMSNA
jgi:hypothetical protein